MEKVVTLNGKEQKRLLVMNELLAGRLTGWEAAEMLGVTLRHTRRLLAAYRRDKKIQLEEKQWLLKQKQRESG